MSRSGKEEKMSRKNGKKLLIVIAVGAVVIKAVRDVIKTKKQEEALKTALDDFYEEELNWWDREHEERNCRYGNENTAPQAVGSTMTGEGQIRKEVHCAGGNNTKNDCPCNQDIQTDRECSPEGNEDVSGASEA